jgi:hypothetical protein
MLAACFLASYWLARVWEISSGISRCFSLAGGVCKFYATPEENDQYSAYRSYCNTSSNDKIKQLTLFSSRKLAITAINNIFSLENHLGPYKI